MNNLPRVFTTWAVVGLLAASFIMVSKWAVLATPLNKAEGLAKVVGTW